MCFKQRQSDCINKVKLHTKLWYQLLSEASCAPLWLIKHNTVPRVELCEIGLKKEIKKHLNTIFSFSFSVSVYRWLKISVSLFSPKPFPDQDTEVSTEDGDTADFLKEAEPAPFPEVSHAFFLILLLLWIGTGHFCIIDHKHYYIKCSLVVFFIASW